jgi:putative ABC transport system ATP-binding protein
MIRGPSGGGKTSLLNVIGTLDGATSGVVKLFGSDISGLKDAELSALRLEKIGFVFQSFNLLSTLSAFENVELPMSLLGKRNKAQRRSAALSLLRLVGLESRSSHLPSELSGGEQQRVAIARALANEPDLLLLDEPTGDLDTAATVMIMDLLLKINTGPRKMTAVMVTHNPDLECYADRVLYVAGGTIAGVAVNEQQSQLDADNYKKFLERDGGEGDIDD